MEAFIECFKISKRLTRRHSHFLRQLTPTHQKEHLIHACSTDLTLACGNVDKIGFFILGAFPLKKRAADFLIESKSAFENRKVFHLPVDMVEVQEYPMN